MTIRCLHLAIVVSTLLLGCSAPDDELASKPIAQIDTARWTDSTQLKEADSALVAEVGGFSISGQAEIFVSDVASGQVFAFAPSGALVRKIGRRGRGPGEMLAPSVLEVTTDGQLLVVDNATGRISRFQANDGTYLGATRLLGPTLDLRVDATGAWMTTTQVASNTSLARLTLGVDSLLPAGVLPSEYTTYPRLLRSMALGVLAMGEDNLWVGMQGTNSIDRYPRSGAGAPTSRVEIPRRRRRGVPLDNPTSLKAEMSYEDEVGSTSLLWALGALDNTRLATVHIDATMAATGLSVSAFLSIVDPATGEGCHDIAIPIDGGAVPAVRFFGSILYLVEPKAQADNSSQTWVRWLDTSDLACG